MNLLQPWRTISRAISPVSTSPAQQLSAPASRSVSTASRARALFVSSLVCLGFVQSANAALNPPNFSQPRGFYTNPFSLTLTVNPADTSPTLQIHYTLDGSAPTATTGLTYSSPISIPTTKVVRAVVFDSANTANVSTSVTNTYLFTQHVLGEPADIPSASNPNFADYPSYPRETYDVGNSRTAVHDYEMDPEIVNDPTYGPLMLGSLTAVPTMSIAVDPTTMFGSTGFYDADAEVPSSMELLYPNTPASNQQINGSIQGHSSVRLKRSLRLSWSSTFGPSKFTSNFLQGAPVNGNSATTSFDTIVLRAGNNRSWARVWNPDVTAYTEDQWYRDTSTIISGVGSHGTFVHLYINGLYWGLYNPAERPDESFAAAYLGGKKGGYFSLKEDGRTKGDATRWNYLAGPLIAKDMTVPANYTELQGYLDVGQFSDYLLLAWFTATNDWSNNNWWVTNRNDIPGPARFFAWDGEWSWDRGNRFDPSINGETPHGAWVHPAFRAGSTDSSFQAQFWRALRVNTDFMTTFADHVYQNVSVTGPLSDINSRVRWNRLNLFVEDAVIAESARWGDAITPTAPRTRDVDWQRAVDDIYGLMGGNGARFIAALRAESYYPSIDAPLFSHVGGVVAQNTQITLSNPNASGALYYTTDGSDPRLSGGAVNATAQVYSGAITIASTTTVKARVLNGTEWSALAAAVFTPISVNTAPIVAAVGPIAVTNPNAISLNATASDDGLPSNTLTLQWTATGPGTVTFASPAALNTTATFSAAGSYVLHFTASDGSLQAQSDVPVFVSPAPPPAGGVLSSFTLINADTDLPIPGYETLSNGAVLDLTTLPTKNLNIRANTTPTLVGSVRFAFKGNSNFRTETGSPYSLYGDSNGNYAAWAATVGSYTLKGTPYSGPSASGSAGLPLTIGFTIVKSAPSDSTPPSIPTNLSSSSVGTNSFVLNWSASSDNIGVTGYEVFKNGVSVGTSTTTNKSITGLTPNTSYSMTVRARDSVGNWSDQSAPLSVVTAQGNAVVSFTLINADTDTAVPGYDAIPNGAVIDRTSLPTTHLNIRVNTNPATVGSVRIGFDAAANARTETEAPYALFGDTAGNFNAGTIANGTHTVKGTPFSGASGQGTAGTALSVSFTIQ